MNPEKTGAIARFTQEAYFSPKPWERNGTLSRHLGVRTVKKHILNGDLRSRRLTKTGENPEAARFLLSKPTLDATDEFERATRKNEAKHLAGLIATVAIFPYLNTHLGTNFAVFISGSAEIMHLYAIMIQRYNRARIYSLRRKKEDKLKNKTEEFQASF